MAQSHIDFYMNKKKSKCYQVITSEIMKMKTEKRNTFIFFVGGFLKITFHAKLKHKPSHLNI